jgi:hypothetical protein
MLPAIIDRNERFQIMFDDTRGFHALLVTSDQLGSPKPFVPHWVGTCLDRGTLNALVRWLAFRRDQWQDWGRLAERIGRDAFAQHMHEMRAVEPLKHVIGTTMMLQDDPCEVTIGEQLQDESRVRTELIYRHRFASAAMRNRFHRWFHTGDNFYALEGLVHLAYSGGAKALGIELDRLAAATFSTAKRRKPRKG